MKHIIDIENWVRKDNFEFFKEFDNPYIGVTCNVDCKRAYELSKQRDESFFIYYLYAILEAFNDIEEFRYRIDPQGRVVCYDWVDVITPIKLEGMATFANVKMPYLKDKGEFYARAKSLVSTAADLKPYDAENSSTEFNMICISALHKLPFTAMTFTCQKKGGNDFPLINVGQMSDDFKIPIAISAHHGFVDGEHITRLFDRIARTLLEY